MKHPSPTKISTVALWVCMALTVALAAWFYFFYSLGFSMSDTPQTSFLISWMYVVAGLTVASIAGFTVFYFIRRPKKAAKSLLFLLGFFVVLFVAFLLGSSAPLEINGYRGAENTPFFLRLTDMWIYSIAALVLITFLALVAGIFWSYLKKIH